MMTLATHNSKVLKQMLRGQFTSQTMTTTKEMKK
jgi:hypothetical protein